MIFTLFDGFSWFLGNVKILWFLNILTYFHDFWAMWKSHDFLILLTVFHDFWEKIKIFKHWRFFMISRECKNLMIFKHWRFFMISRQCENLMIFKQFDGFSWFLGNPGQCENLMIFKYFDSFSWFLGNVKISLLSWF